MLCVGMRLPGLKGLSELSELDQQLNLPGLMVEQLLLCKVPALRRMATLLELRELPYASMALAAFSSRRLGEIWLVSLERLELF